MVGWFEIPVKDMGRAIRFYEKVMDVKLEQQDLGGLQMAWFPAKEDALGAAGSLVQYKELYKPSTEGVLIYFTSRAGDLSVELGRVEEAGGEVLMAKKLITEEIGYMGMFLDTEGNRIALHSRK